MLCMETMGQRGIPRAKETRRHCARGLEHKQERAWAMAPEQNASIESGTACKVVSSNGVARIGSGQGSMRETTFQGTAGYVTRMSGGVRGRGREASSYLDWALESTTRARPASMTRSLLLRHLSGMLLSILVAVAAQAAQPIEVRFKVIDSAGQAIIGAPIRLVLALGQTWHLPEAGMRATTGSGGEVNWTANALPERRRRKLPTNFFTQVLAPAEDTIHLAVGVELTYLARAWLVVGAGDRFDNGTTAQLDGLKIYGRDQSGNFSLPAVQKEGAWYLPGVPGALTTPGFLVHRLAIAPAERGWTMEFTVQRASEPVAR